MVRGSLLISTVVACLGLFACGDMIEGPKPQPAAPAAQRPITPAYLCAEQIETDLVIHGEGFAPLVQDLPSSAHTVLPTIILTQAQALNGQEEDSEPRLFSGVDAPMLSWQSQQQMTFHYSPELKFSPGLYDLEVRSPIDDKALASVPLAVVDAPELLATMPRLSCLAEGPREIVVTGMGFLTVAEAEAQVAVGELTLPVEAFSECFDVAHPSVAGQSCQTATFTLEQDALEPSYSEVVISNPETAACHSEEVVKLRIVPPPSLAEVAPSLACPEQSQVELKISGADLLEIDAALPTAEMINTSATQLSLEVLGIDDCVTLETMEQAVSRCESLHVRLPTEEIEAPYTPTLFLENPAPAGCHAEVQGPLVLVPAPAITEVDPLMICRGNPEVRLNVQGMDFYLIDGVQPTVMLGDQLGVDAQVADCEPLPVERMGVLRCASLEATFNPNTLEDVEVLTITNPRPADCTTSHTQRIAVIDPPIVSAIEPSLICVEDGAVEVAVRGDNFIQIAEALPSLGIAGVGMEVLSLDECEERSEGALSWRVCAALNGRVPQGALIEGRPPVEVSNPAPLSCAGAEEVLTVPPPLRITAVIPPSVCSETLGADLLTVEGTGFLEIDGVGPTLTLDGQAAEVDLSGCEEVTHPDHAVRACTRFSATLPVGLNQGSIPIAIENPAPSGCGELAEELFFVVPVPEITSVEPQEICEGELNTITIHGHDFMPVARVSVGSIPADAVRFIDEGTLEADFDMHTLTPLQADVSVHNAEGCAYTLPLSLDVHPTPIIFYIDPAVAHNDVSIIITLYTTGLDAPVTMVSLLSPSGEVVELDATSDPTRHNKITATLPAGLETGDWTVRLISALGCVGEWPAGFHITDDLSLGLTGLDPAFVSPSQPTAVNVRATPAGDQVGFHSVPHAYLNPNPPVEGAIAMALRALVYVDERSFTAVVPEGLPPGAYDLIVVNPDGTVGLLEAGVTVTTGEPPVVKAVEPASLDGNGVQRVRVFGEGFDLIGVTARLSCQTQEGALIEADGQVDASTLQPDGFEVDLPGDAAPAGSICLIIVTNADGSSTRHSALSIKTPAQNLNDWSPGPQLEEARRAPALIAGRATQTSRYLYAIGGDNGDPSSARSSVEASSVDLFGEMGSWSIQRNALPTPRTSAAVARVGRFIYLLGGDDGQGITDSVLRAQILDPLAGPEIFDIDLDLNPEEAEGLGEGLWHYRISAVYPEDDPQNPGGESLPGEVLSMQLPALDGLGITLLWTEVPRARSYRVYRTGGAEQRVGEVYLLAETSELSYTDHGEAVDAELSPLPSGSLGVWHSAGQLNTPRETAAFLAVEDDTGGWIYLFGGRGDAGALDTVEIARIDTQPNGDQQLRAFQINAQRLATARAELGAMRVTHADLEVIPEGEVWVFLGPGRTDHGISRGVEAAPINAAGALGAFIQTDEVNGDLAGYGYGSASGFLFLFGARGGPSDGGISAEICRSADAPGCGRDPNEPPDIRNWNNLGVNMSEARIHMGSTQESAFFFIVGGSDGARALRSVDQTVQ